MATYIVNVPEIFVTRLRVEAASEKEAITLGVEAMRVANHPYWDSHSLPEPESAMADKNEEYGPQLIHHLSAEEDK
jgi:hypothetical protein